MEQNNESKSDNLNLNFYKKNKLYVWYFILFLFLISLFYFPGKSFSPKEIAWNQFYNDMFLNGDVEKLIVVNKEKVEVYIKPGRLTQKKYESVSKGLWNSTNKGPHFYFTIGSVEAFENKLSSISNQSIDKGGIDIRYVTIEKSWFISLLSWVLPFALLFYIWFFAARRMSNMGGGMKGGIGSFFDFGKSNPVVYSQQDGKMLITFKDVAGYEEAKIEVMEIVEFLKHPDTYTALGAKIPKGVLLVGASGTGKTLMAKAVAGEAQVPFFSLSASEFIEMFVGVGASRVRDLFKKAKQKSPCIIFIDEIDTIGRIRSKALTFQSNDERESTLNQLLAEMDGFAPNEGIIVMAATNRSDILDPALLRPGRFDRHIILDLPTKSEREAIFKVHSKNLLIDKTLDLDFLASQTPGFSGADIANVCNESALIAARKKKKAIQSVDFFDAIDRIVGGIEKKSKIVSKEEKKIIAYHEAGHVITAWMLKHVDPIVKVTIIPRGKSLGSSWFLPEERQLITASQFKESLVVSLGGRAAEELIFNECSSGALDDLEKVTKQAYSMVAHLGMNETIGSVSYYDSNGMYENSFQKPYSEDTAKIIDEQVRLLIQQSENNAKELIQKNMNKLHSLAELLQKNEIIYKAELDSLLGLKNANN